MNRLVTVYGSLRQGFHNHYLLGDSRYLGTEVLEGGFTMLDLGSFPGVVLEGDMSITVEVYEVDDTNFSRLDMLEGYPSFYDRTQIRTTAGDAWIYFLSCKDEWTTSIIDSGDWADTKAI